MDELSRVLKDIQNEKQLSSIELDDIGLGERFALTNKHNTAWISGLGWMVYKGGK